MSSLAKSLAVVLCAAGLAAVATTSEAADVGQHPAVYTPRALPSLDANSFRPGHPASPTMRRGHANAEHPAVARPAPVLDTNHFLVQPPASVHWDAPAIDVAGQPVAALAR